MSGYHPFTLESGCPVQIRRTDLGNRHFVFEHPIISATDVQKEYEKKLLARHQDAANIEQVQWRLYHGLDPNFAKQFVKVDEAVQMRYLDNDSGYELQHPESKVWHRVNDPNRQGYYSSPTPLVHVNDGRVLAVKGDPHYAAAMECLQSQAGKRWD